ncbi:NhaP-type Na+/H+ or K+/H+ antiporter [Treponema rectale]|uniref:NhaP-type Na+/H+ or K+/H+ antiporter n=2 Tax=Treponema rectale TaxID=744512 RepID=A0A840S911_9SPIR|nr:cation:proton antiporter [Treponema rectale]MBB5219159.1 NhaP-type Na+/H+ or K+/H+ antiporter [Treponema rectale]
MNPFMNVLPKFMHFSNLGPRVAIVLGLMLFFGTCGGHIFQKLKIPQVVGYFIIGIILGDSGLQLIRPDVVSALNPISVIALAFIGFLVGGELKTDVIKKMGKQFVSVLLFESLVPAVVVAILTGFASYFFTHNVELSFCFGILLGAICSSTAPEATTNVLQEYRSRGPLTTMIYGLVAMDDAVALILFAIVSTVAAPILGGHAVSFGRQMLNVVYNVFGSIAFGLLLGWILSFILKKLTHQEGRVLSFTLGLLLLCTGICDRIGLSNILAAMSIGFYIANFTEKNVRQVFDFTNKFTPPVYVLFFVVVGAKLNIWEMKPLLIVLAALYIIGRTGGKALGSWFGAYITKAPVTVQKYMKYCLLSQAGVAIGLSLTAGNYFKDTIGDSILLIVTATTFVAELIGPVFVKIGITKAEEAGMNVTEDDILKRTRVSDVTWGTEKACDCNSCAIVADNAIIRDILTQFERHHYQSFVVKSSSDGKLEGIITLAHLKETLLIGEMAETLLAVDIMDRPVCTCHADTSLPDVYDMFSENDTEAIPIVDADGRALGVLEKFAADHYIHTRILEVNRKLESLG